MSDLSLHRTVMRALADNPHVHADRISAQVADGTVIRGGMDVAEVRRSLDGALALGLC
jgi:hypothetical protein